MTCKECVYFYYDEGEKYESCHFDQNTCWDVPPCEQEDIDREREIDEMEWEREKEQINEEYGFDSQKELERIQEELEKEYRLSSIYADTDSAREEV